MASFRNIKDQIAEGKALEMTDSELRIRQTISFNDTKMVINTDTILSKYKPLLKKYISKFELSGDDAVKYNYKVNMLSYDLYGTIELAPLILQINNMVSANQFTDLEKGILLFSPNITNFLNEIMLKEEKVIQANREKIVEEVS